MAKNKLFLLLFSFLFSLSSLGQGALKYLVLLKDKNNSPYQVSQAKQFLSARAIDRRAKQNIAINTQDFPVNTTYINQIKQTGAKVWYTSRWMNAALVEATPEELTQILALNFVKGLEGKGALRSYASMLSAARRVSKFAMEDSPAPTGYGLSETQNLMLGVDAMHNQGFQGQNMLIAVFDAGFTGANTIPAFSHLFNNNRVIQTYDFVENNTFVYNYHSHGTNVLSCIASLQTGKMIGTAPEASYALFRTEDDDSESILEEVNWLIAAERADSLGVDLINSSLGYTVFDDANTNHTYQDMNGKTTIAARAAKWAAQRGIICTISAGNEGADTWKYISTPADADSIIAVGAVSSTRNVASFSSRGPSSDGRIKPDLSAMGQSVAVLNTAGNVTVSSGTSFSSPILCGMVAGLWQALPNKKAQEIIQLLKETASDYSAPNNTIGYGIPNFNIAYLKAQIPLFEGISLAFPNPINDQLKIALSDFSTQKNYNYQIFDSQGNEILQGSISNAITFINSSNWSKGTYILKLTVNQQIVVHKIIKL
ncbi:S8 family serine peptidase [Flectobacillus sp. DC10W]|uniref:S8 family serine peptidase n=1 Tax=Flectobacillus longus TaxID=2984207 RepID=A0ABT6YNK5_9BACT|nr:S8 family serine peptidase [Flectobacillus longus]MDI9865032.1 S8 family serine peptidase [Flectobacillus longus]